MKVVAIVDGSGVVEEADKDGGGGGRVGGDNDGGGSGVKLGSQRRR